MHIDVLLFASYADALGRSQVRLELPDGATVGDLVHRLHESAGSGTLPARPLVAVNQRYARWEQPIASGDEVAVIPPVAGG